MSGATFSWSRRRAAVAAEAEAEERAAEDAVIREEQKALAEKSDAEILEELGLPDPDCLVQGDDFKAFMAKAVPQHLRNRALRKLWRSNPVLACVDGLNDYDGDYLTGSTGQGAIKTGYQVGKGMLAHLLDVERQAEALASEEPETEDETPQDEAGEADEDTPMMAEAAEREPTAAPVTRRMQFQFEEDRA